MRIAFMGTPDFAVPTLDALVTAGHDVAAVYTQPPRPANRGKKPALSAVHRRAEELGLTVRHPDSLRDAGAQAGFAALELDLAVVAAYGLILPQAILDAPRRGCLNVHGSLLPRWRGAAPVQRAILAGDTTTGITIMQMEAGLDTGPMLARLATEVGRKTAGGLTAELAATGAELMIAVLRRLDTLEPAPQPDEGVTYAAKIDKAEAHIDFAASAAQIERQCRAFDPAPGAWFDLEGERVRAFAGSAVRMQGPAGVVLDDELAVGCGDGAIRFTQVQRSGRPRMPAADFLRGRPVPAGTRLG